MNLITDHHGKIGTIDIKMISKRASESHDLLSRHHKANDTGVHLK